MPAPPPPKPVRKLTPEMVARIHARKRAGIAVAAIARELDLCRPTVMRGLAMPDPGAEARARERRAPDPDESTLEDAMDQGDDLEDAREALAGRTGEAADTVELLSETLLELRSMARSAKHEDQGAFLAITRQIVQVGKELVRHIPPPAPDPEQDPKNIAAAAAFRDKLRLMLAQRRGLLAELAEWREMDP